MLIYGYESCTEFFKCQEKNKIKAAETWTRWKIVTMDKIVWSFGPNWNILHKVFILMQCRSIKGNQGEKEASTQNGIYGI